MPPLRPTTWSRRSWPTSGPVSPPEDWGHERVAPVTFRPYARRDIETFYVKDDAEFDKVGNIAALLRFRSENVQPISPAVADELGRAGAAGSKLSVIVRDAGNLGQARSPNLRGPRRKPNIR